LAVFLPQPPGLLLHQPADMADLPEPIDYRQLPVSHSKHHPSFREPKCNNPMIAAVIPGFRNRQQVEDIL